MSLTCRFFLLCFARLLLLCCCTTSVWATNAVDLPSIHPSIPLLDKNAENVLDTQLPYSSRLSCGGCHDMEKIGHAYHYEMGRDENDEQFGRARGMGALVSPGYFGGYNCMQGNNPQWLSKKSNTSQQNFLDYGAAGFIKACERCHTGGGFAEKDRTGRRYDSVDTAEIALFDGDYYEWDTQNTLQPWNWKRSGVIEPDCLACHVDFSGFTPTASQWSDLRNDQFIANGWFEYANSAIFAFLNVNTRQAEGAGKFLLSVENAGTQATPPTLKWHASAFDENGEIALPLRRFPASENCMQCHITSHERRGFYGFGDDVKVDSNPDKLAPVNPKSDVHKGKSWTEKGKVRTIENCNACHSKNYYKSGIDLSVDHQFLTGFSDQDVRRDLNYQPKPLSCEHCHGGKEWGSAEKPALPYSGQSTLLAAHRERWLSRGDMEGYATSTYNKTVQTHFNVVACQTCHITGLVDEKNQPLRLRYRYRLSEDGKPRIIPYLPASRYYWIDSTNQRVLSRAERLAATNGVESEPKTYQEIKTLKTRFDELLKAKGYANANTQMVWTESNDYLISHNTRPVAQTMPCVDCHDRKSNGAINPLVSDTKILGASNERVVSELSDANAYPQLIKEGIVKLGLPYLSVSAQGKLVENVNDVLYDTKLNPFTSMLQSNQVNTLSGAMQVGPRGDVLNALSSTQSAALSTKLAKQVLWLRNPLIGDKMKNGWLLANDSNFNQRVLSNYRFALSAMAWSKTPSKKTPSFSMGTLGSEVFAFQSRCLQPEADCLLDVFLMKDKLMLKLPYTGNVNNVTGVGLYAVTAAKEGEFNAPKTRIPADIIAVTARNEVILAVNTLPEYAVLVDLKNAKK